MIERIRTWSTEVGEPPKSTDWNPAKARLHAQDALDKARQWTGKIQRFEGGEWPSTWTVRKLFGSFNAALAQAGIEGRPTGRTPHVVTERQVAALRHHARGEAAGPSQLAVKIKHVMEARQAQDKLALRAALFDLAATALAWCDQIEAPAEERIAA